MENFINGMAVSLPGPTSRTARLPLLVEISLTVSQILVFVAAGTTAVLSILAGADVLNIFVRTGVAILGIGIPAFLLNWLIGRYFVEATVTDWVNSIPKKEFNEPSESKTHEVESNA
jgi:hypothetical protein